MLQQFLFRGHRLIQPLDAFKTGVQQRAAFHRHFIFVGAKYIAQLNHSAALERRRSDVADAAARAQAHLDGVFTAAGAG